MVVFLLTGRGGEKSKLGSQLTTLLPALVGCVLGYWEGRGWEPGTPCCCPFCPQACSSHSCLSPLWSPGAAPVL